MAQSVQIQKVNWWHERLADLMIANPHCTLGELARALDKSPAWISIVKNSDAFIDYWRRRSDAHSLAVTDDIATKMRANVDLANEALNLKLSTQSELMTVETLLDVIDINTKRLGYGANPAQAPTFNFNLGAVTPEQLAEARAKLRARELATEVEATPVAPALPAPREENSGE